MCGVRIVTTVDAARNNDPYRWRLFFHDADLNGRGMRAEQKSPCPVALARLDVKSVLGIASRVIGWGVKRVEAVIFVLYLWTICDNKTNFTKAANNVFSDLCQRMQFADQTTAPG